MTKIKQKLQNMFSGSLKYLQKCGINKVLLITKIMLIKKRKEAKAGQNTLKMLNI